MNENTGDVYLTYLKDGQYVFECYSYGERNPDKDMVLTSFQMYQAMALQTASVH